MRLPLNCGNPQDVFARGAERPIVGLSAALRPRADAGFGPMRSHADLHVRPETRSLDAAETNAARADVPFVVRGPGSAGVTPFARRIVRALRRRGTARNNCLVIAGTLRTADVLRTQLDLLMPGDTEQIAIHTLHSLGLSILREHGALVGLNRGFRVARKADQTAIFAEMRGFPASKMETALHAISYVKRGVSPCDEDVADTFAAYQQGLMLRNLVDRDDAVRLSAQLLKAHPAIAALLTRHFTSIFVEPQDMDEQQASFVRTIAASASLPGNDRRRLQPERGCVTVHAELTEFAEAAQVAETIKGLLHEGHSPADFAVLYRCDAHSSALATRLEQAGIPFRRHSDAPIADDPTVHALFLELHDVPGDEPLADRLQAAAQRLHRDHPEYGSESIERALQRLRIVADWSSRNGLRFADAFALASDVQFIDARAELVTLVSLEAVKGLEFRTVFIVGLEHGNIPLDGTSLDEERKLFDRGVACARDRLYLSRALRRQHRGDQELSPSPFLEDIERELLKHQHPLPQAASRVDQQLKLF